MLLAAESSPVQNSGDTLGQQHGPARPSLDVFKGMPVEGEYTTSLAPSTFLDAGFGSDYTAAANPNALRKQTVNLEETLPPAKRESRRPQASAFQNAASQGCELLLRLCLKPHFYWTSQMHG